MPGRNEDRAQPITIAFRVSPELNEKINLLVGISGMTKQDYIVSKLLDLDMRVEPSPVMYRTLRDEMREVCRQLNRVRKGESPSEHLLETCDILADVFLSLRGDKTGSEVECEDDAMRSMLRS